MSNPRFNNIRELSIITGIPVRTLRTLFYARKISGIKTGGRTLLFEAEKVCAELKRFEVQAIG